MSFHFITKILFTKATILASVPGHIHSSTWMLFHANPQLAMHYHHSKSQKHGICIQLLNFNDFPL